MIAYKIVKKNFTSYILNEQSGDFVLEYKIGKITKSIKNSLGIFCFKTLEAAKCFAGEPEFDQQYKILKIEGTKVLPVSEISGCIAWLALKSWYCGYAQQGSMQCPKETICFKEILPLEIVEENVV